MTINPFRSFPKAIPDLTDDELREEYQHWDWAISNATAWGVALAAASEFIEDTKQEMLRRKLA